MRCKSWLAIVGLSSFPGVIAVFCVPGHPALADARKKSAAKPVPFKLAKADKPLILLETMVNDKGPFRFVLDTGAAGTVVSPALAKKLRIQPEKQEKATGAGGSIDVHFGTVKSLKVGETQLERLEVVIMDLTGIGKAIETDVDGIIGYNFLRNLRVTIDYPNQTVTFE